MTWSARLLQSCSRLRLRRCAQVGDAPQVLGRLWIHGKGRVLVGDRVRIYGEAAPVELKAALGGEIVIGNDVEIHAGVSIESHGRVTIGDGCRLEGFCKIMDTNFHPTRGNRREGGRPEASSVVLEPGAQIGYRAIVLPGAWVKRGAIVKAATVVRPAPAAMRREGALSA